MTTEKTTTKDKTPKALSPEAQAAEDHVNKLVAEGKKKDDELRAKGIDPDAKKGTKAAAPPKKAAEAAPKSAEAPKGKAKSAASTSAASDALGLAGYAKAFEHWEMVPTEAGPIEANPAEIVTIFDVRTELKPITTFLKETAKGVKTPGEVSLMKYLGETVTGHYSPDPKREIKLVKGTVYKVLTFGRRRTWAGLEHGFKLMNYMLANYPTWKEKVEAAFTENEGREQMSQWDTAIHVKNLKDSGLKNEDIAREIPRLGTGTVSQLIGVFEVAPPVRKHFKNGALGTTAIRQLRPLEDQDLQVKLADMAVEKGWGEKELGDAITTALAKGAKTKREPAKGKKEVKLAMDYSTVALKATPVAEVREELVVSDTKYQQLKAKKAAPEKIQYAKGYLDGLRKSFGIA